MRAEWDPEKAVSNLQRHGVDFADAVVALEDENALTVEDSCRYEQRFKTLALGPRLRVLLIVHAPRGDSVVRIISARQATRAEARTYFRGLSHV